jgi:hypothetical protein
VRSKASTAGAKGLCGKDLDRPIPSDKDSKKKWGASDVSVETNCPALGGGPSEEEVLAEDAAGDDVRDAVVALQTSLLRLSP